MLTYPIILFERPIAIRCMSSTFDGGSHYRSACCFIKKTASMHAIFMPLCISHVINFHDATACLIAMTAICQIGEKANTFETLKPVLTKPVLPIVYL